MKEKNKIYDDLCTRIDGFEASSFNGVYEFIIDEKFGVFGSYTSRVEGELVFDEVVEGFVLFL